MKADEIQWSFIEEVRQNSGIETVTSDDVFYWFNKAQETFVENRYETNNVKGQGFEQTQKRIDDIRTLITDYSTTCSCSTIELPTNYLHLIRLHLKVSKDGCTPSIVYPKQVKQDNLNKIMNDPFNKPNYFTPLYFFSDQGEIEVLLEDGSSLEEIYITYIRKPKYVTINDPVNEKQFSNNTYVNVPELPNGVHREILDLAIKGYLGSLPDQRYEIKLNEIRNQE